MSYCRCGGCDATFSSLRAFDTHRTGPYRGRPSQRRCLSESEMRAAGLVVHPTAGGKGTKRAIWTLEASLVSWTERAAILKTPDIKFAGSRGGRTTANKTTPTSASRTPSARPARKAS